MRRYRLLIVIACAAAAPLLGRGLMGCSSSTPLGSAADASNDVAQEPAVDGASAPDGSDATTGPGTDGGDGAAADEAAVPDGGAPDQDAPDGQALDAQADGPGPEAGATLDGGADAALDGGTDGGDGGLSPTAQALYNISPSCLDCAVDGGAFDLTNTGSDCEERLDENVGYIHAFQPTEAANCLDTLHCELTANCDTTGDPTTCLCGTVDPNVCFNDTGTTTLNGPCTQDYYDGFGTMDVTQFSSSFSDPTYPPGSATNLVAVLVNNNCTTCFP
jgi:hypothetical protein